MPPPLIPLPLQYETLPGQCKLPSNLLIGCCGQGVLDVGSYLASYLTESLQLDAQAHGADGRSSSHRIFLCCMESPQLASLTNNDEAYELVVAEDGVRIQGNRPHGIFNGVQSLIQLLPCQPPQAADIVLDCLQVGDTWPVIVIVDVRFLRKLGMCHHDDILYSQATASDLVYDINGFISLQDALNHWRCEYLHIYLGSLLLSFLVTPVRAAPFLQMPLKDPFGIMLNVEEGFGP